MTIPPATPRTSPAPGPSVLVGAAIVLLALNLRTVVGSVGVVLDALRADLGMDATVAGVLTTLPVLCFALVGPLTSSVVRAVGLDRAAALLLVVVATGLALRPYVDHQGAFLALTVLALAGCAVGNVLLPALTKAHFPDHVPLVSSLYGAALMAGGALGSLVTVPLADALGGWRPGLAVWAVLAVAALLPWLPSAIGAGRRVKVERRGPSLRQVARSPLAWAVALCFGAQSAQAYAQFGWFPAMLVDAGLSPASAGAMQGLLGGIGIPMTLLLPFLLARWADRGILPVAFATLTLGGWIGVLLAPAAAPWLWAMLLGMGGCTFTWVLTMIGRRTRSADGTAALSAFGQSVGYVVAGLGPFGTGLLHDLTGGWTVPILVLMSGAVVMGALGVVLDRGRYLEDDLAT